jgi:dTDP-4-dehydrorhamnose 3,5-epimerase
MIKDVHIEPLKIISAPDGDVLHAIKRSDASFLGFGEAYFSTVSYGAIKAWKRHNYMTLNLIVPTGAIRFVLFDDRDKSVNENRRQYQVVVLSRDNYYRLTVPAGIWMGFQGLSDGVNMLLNVADIPHDPQEVDRIEIDKIEFDWSIGK